MENIGSPVKVLFVVMDFWQAGAERFAYEVDSALNKTKFEISILSIRDLNSTSDFADYYFTKHLNLGTKISFLKDVVGINHILKRRLHRIISKIPAERTRNTILPLLKQNKKERERINSFIDQFSVVNWMGEYTFSYLRPLLNDSVYGKSVIHLMNAKFQQASVYHDFPKNKHYIFTSGFNDADQVRYELSEFSDYEHVLFPLYLNISRTSNCWIFKNRGKKKIGVFTRLDPMKPLDPFIYAFHLLLDKIPGLELHIFGTGDPVQSGMKRFTINLGISDKVFFRGHQEDIVQTAADEGLDLVWFQGYKNRPAGYAGFDICMTGIPQLFWDFTHKAEELEHYGVAYPNFKNLNLFVEKSFEILIDEKTATALSNLQFNDLIQNRDMSKNVFILENLFMQIAS